MLKQHHLPQRAASYLQMRAQEAGRGEKGVGTQVASLAVVLTEEGARTRASACMLKGMDQRVDEGGGRPTRRVLLHHPACRKLKTLPCSPHTTPTSRTKWPNRL